MTTNIEGIIAEAFEAGRKAERELSRIGAAASEVQSIIGEAFKVGHTMVPVAVRLPRKAAGTKASKESKTSKAPVKAVTTSRGRKEARPRQTGVKDAIFNLIKNSHGHLTIPAIVSHTGFKATSVRATLMAMKKGNLVGQDANKCWVLSEEAFGVGGDGGNSQTEQATA